MRSFRVLATKELMNLLRDRKLVFGLVVIPLVLFPLLGQFTSMGLSSAQGVTKVAVVNMDSGSYGGLLVKTLNASPNVSLTLISAGSVEKAIEKARDMGQNVLVVIPPDFSKRLSSSETASVQVYGIFTRVGAGMKESVSEGRINSVIQLLNREIAMIKLKELGINNPKALVEPVNATSYSVVKGRIVKVPPSAVAAALSSQAFSVPLIIFIMITLTAQMAAGSMAAEKENKTLETLLTLPVSRTTIVASKVFGTAVMGLIAALAYMIGMKYYMGALSMKTNVSLSSIGLGISPAGMVLLAIVIFLAVVFSLSLAMLIAVFAEDVQTASTLVSAVVLPLAFPSFILMYTSIYSLPACIRWLLLAIPFTHPIVDYRKLLMGNYSFVILSVLYLTLIALVTLYVTARVFSTERVLTAQINWGRKRWDD
ncbi:MAG: ABC transporter permease [Thermococci archaeon]|nr:ABC transporter permease [Thermococci archaeon]